ncbi:CPBP family intramembrane glutamic endopeptidase [Streptococcus dentasini]
MKLFFNILKVIGLLVLAICCNMVPILLLRNQSYFSLPLKWGLGLLCILFIIAVFTLLWRSYKKHEPETVKLQKMTWGDIGYNFLFFLAARAVAVFGTLILAWISGQSQTANDQALAKLTDFFQGGFFLYTALYCLMIGLMAPLIEELAFRGFPQVLLFKQRKILAGLVTSSIFSLGHAATIPEFFLYALLGAVLYSAYQRRGNIKDSMMVHVFNNLPSAIYLLLIGFGLLH